MNICLYSATFIDRQIYGNRIILPISYIKFVKEDSPLFFTINDTVCVGVLDFNSPDENAYVSKTTIDHLFIEEGSLVSLKAIDIPVATFVQFKDKESSSPEQDRELLERGLRHFPCLTEGQEIEVFIADPIFANGKTYNSRMKTFVVEKTTPSNFVSIVDIDLPFDVISEKPVIRPKKSYKQINKGALFPGVGYRLGRS